MKSIQSPFGNIKALQFCLYPLEDLGHHQVVTWTLECKWVELNYWEYLILTKLRISQSINYMIIFFVISQIVMSLASCNFACFPKNLANLIPIQLIVLPLMGLTWNIQFWFWTLLDSLQILTNQSKWSKWADSKFGFWTLFDSVQFMDYQSKLWKWADPQFGFWTLFESVQFMDYQSKWSIQWYRSKKIRLF